MDRAKIVEKNYLQFLQSYRREHIPIKTEFGALKDTYKAMIQSRLLDYEGRTLKSVDKGYYTIGSAGHEANAVFGTLLAKHDPCLLHYRSGALMMARAKAFGYAHMAYDTLLSFCASKDDPISGGRHKVWGNKALWVPPQTSTIASHLPKAVGMAFGIGRAQKLAIDTGVDANSIVFVSFGDASCNHATAQTAFNAASWSTYQKLPTPVFFLCEDNGLGISVRTPHGWIASQMQARPDIEYFYADGSNMDDVFQTARKAIEFCRVTQKPVFFHLKTVRLFGHAGSDVETAYRSLDEIQEMEKLDPLMTNAKVLLNAGVFTPNEILHLYKAEQHSIAQLSSKATQAPQIASAEEVAEALYRPQNKTVFSAEVSDQRNTHFMTSLGFMPEQSPKKRHLAMLMNWALQDVMLKERSTVLFGEDVARKGGVYHVTNGLQEAFGSRRVFNTLLDETTILGLSIGMSQVGFLPIAEIQYLAYYHNAQDQIRSEAASQSFFSNGQFSNPMVIRIASFAYQKGFGGHFHNDNSLAALLDVPGIMVVSPSRGDDAVEMFHHAIYCARMQGRVVVFLEPIALYMKKDLFEPGDGKWLCTYPKRIDASQPIAPKQYNQDHQDILVISYANGLHMSLQAAKIVEQAYGMKASVVDLRQLKPLPIEAIAKIAAPFDKILLVDECREWGGVCDRIITQLVSRPEFAKKTFQTVQARDTYVPLGPAANFVLPQVADIVSKTVEMVGSK